MHVNMWSTAKTSEKTTPQKNKNGCGHFYYPSKLAKMKVKLKYMGSDFTCLIQVNCTPGES